MEQTLMRLKAREPELEKFPDYSKRKSLFLSWLGQANKCIRKGYLQDRYYHALFWKWVKKAEMLLNGFPLDECKGKVKVKGKHPISKKQRVAWKKERKSEIREYKNEIITKNNANQKKRNED